MGSTAGTVGTRVGVDVAFNKPLALNLLSNARGFAGAVAGAAGVKLGVEAG